MDERIQTATDEQIAAAIAVSPREDLCAELYRRYDKRVYLWCFIHAHESDESIALSQEILEKMVWGIGGFAGGSRFSTWVYQIARNECRGELQKLRGRWRERLRAFEGEFVEALEPGFYEWVDGKCNCEGILESATGAMDKEELQAFVLHYCDGFAVKEITKMLGCRNAAAARTLIQNARRKHIALDSGQAPCGCGTAGGNHASIETLAALLEGRLPARDPDATREHIARCALCDLASKRLERFIGVEADEELARSAEWIYARGKLERAYEERIAPLVAKRGLAASTRRFGLRRSLLIAAVAAVAVAIVAIARLATREGNVPPATGREAMRGALIASYAIAPVAPSGDIEGFPAEFSWKDSRGKSLYTLEIFSPSLERVYAAPDLASTRFASPESLRAVLRPNVIYLWRVKGREDLGSAEPSPSCWFRYGR